MDPKIEPSIGPEYVTEGITENFVWYEASILRRDMEAWSSRLDKLVKVMESRHGEHLHLLEKLLWENRKLKEQVAKLKGEE